LPDQTFIVGTDGVTLGDFADWLENVLGIQDQDALAGNPGVFVDSGTLVINGNAGELNAFSINATDVTSDNSGSPVPFEFTQTGTANGPGVLTSFTVYDSLGAPVVVSATLALEAKSEAGTVWRFYLESPQADGSSRALGTGTVAFDTEGNFDGVSGNRVNLSRAGSGAASPLAFTLDFSNIHGLSTRTSNVIMAEQDGFPPGTLSGYSVGSDGTINGTFTNGMSQTLGQVAVAMMSNPEGLVAEGENLYVLGPNAGQPTITPAELFGAGSIIGGALELSNVDLASEFIGLITSSTGFQASSRVISTSSDMLDQLLLIVR